MLSTDRIIRELIESFENLEARFELLRLIDNEITSGELTIPAVLDAACLRLCTIARASHVSAFLLSDEVYVPMISGEKSDRKLPRLPKQFKVPGAVRAVAVNPDFLGKHSGNNVFIPIHYHNKLCCAILLQDEKPSSSVSWLCDREILDYFESIRHQLSIFFQAKLDSRIALVQQELIQEFFDKQLAPSSCWAAIASRIADLLPDWPPARLDERPRVQLLTYNPGDRFLTLCADDQAKSFLAMPLKVDETISGMLIQRNNEDQEFVDVVQVDPHDHKSRYQGYLYGKNVPHSELIVAIRDKNRVICGLINLEHPARNAFLQLHVDILQSAAKFLGPFVAALIDREHLQQKKEMGLLYVQSKLLQRMASTYRHKIGHWILRSRFALEKLENKLKKTKSDEYRILLDLKGFVDQFAEGSESFLTDLPKYIFFDRVDIVQMTRDAVNEFDPDSLQKTDAIKITFRVDPDVDAVFASKLLREHIHDLIQNACDAVREAMFSGLIPSGEIMVTIERKEVTDLLQDKETAPARVLVRVSDNGGGVPSGKEEEIFDFGVTTKGARGGTGHGLSAAREFARSVGGDVFLQNRVGQGATFTMNLQEYSPTYHDKLRHRFVAPSTGADQ